MRWRFVDSIGRFEPWCAITGRKTVSLEEYCLLEPLGREGVLPESLVLESVVHLARWLVAASSGFEQTCLLADVDRLAFERQVTMGEALDIDITISARDGLRVAVDVVVQAGGESIARGALRLEMLPLADTSEPDCTETMWKELYASS